MEKYISKSALVAEIEREKEKCGIFYDIALSNNAELAKVAIEEQERQYNSLLSFIDTLEVKDPYEQCIQYASIKSGIQAHAEIYSFNIESELFNQLTKEQQALWRKEIEQACISGGEMGVELARDQRYEKKLEVKEVDLDEELIKWHKQHFKKDGTFVGMSGFYLTNNSQMDIAKHFFELGLKAQKGEV